MDLIKNMNRKQQPKPVVENVKLDSRFLVTATNVDFQKVFDSKIREHEEILACIHGKK